MHEPSLSSPDPGVGPMEWLDRMPTVINHTRGLRWGPEILPNDFFFFLKKSPAEMAIASLSYNYHQRYELVVAFEGRAKVCLDCDVYTIEPGTVHWVQPGLFHQYFDFEGESCRWLFFSFLVGPDSGLIPEEGWVRRVNPADPALAFLRRASAAYADRPEGDRQIYAIAREMADFMQWLQRVEAVPRESTIGEPAQDERALLRAISLHLSRTMDQGVRIGDFADELGMSEGHLRRLFRNATGTSLGSWLRRTRFGRGVRLLEQGEMSISEVAQFCGFESIHSFSQAFQRYYKLSPSAYRKRIQAGESSLIPASPSVQEEELT